MDAFRAITKARPKKKKRGDDSADELNVPNWKGTVTLREKPRARIPLAGLSQVVTRDAVKVNFSPQSLSFESPDLDRLDVEDSFPLPRYERVIIVPEADSIEFVPLPTEISFGESGEATLVGGVMPKPEYEADVIPLDVAQDSRFYAKAKVAVTAN